MAGKKGDFLGNYRLVRLIGRGSLSEVYLGEHRYLQSQAAIKVLNTFLAPEAVESFSAEARILSQIIHPHIIRLLDFGMEDETPFVVMDYAPGGNLRQFHPPGKPVPLTSVLMYCQQIASALQHIHNQKLVHRDLKPENVLIGAHGEIFLSDFGLAMISRHSTQYAPTVPIEGTLAYMAPEQFRGKPCYASDQYALAVIAYELLTGKRPFTGTVAELCYQHLQQPPPPFPLDTLNIPALVEQVIFTALAKEPGQRFADMQNFVTALALASQDTETDQLLSLFPSSDISTYAPIVLPFFADKRLPAIPQPLTRLIGRDEVKQAVETLLMQPEVRLLTLTGAGGIGKTRVAQACAEDLREVWTSGISFIQLAAISNPDLVILTLAQALGVKENSEQPIIETLQAFLHPRHMLLILDNFEQVLSAAPLLTELLATCPGVTMLVTSRAALRVRGEREFSIPPLAVPSKTQVTDLEQVSKSAAVALFVERAQAVKPDFHLTETNVEVVVEICRYLDGLPLAIELAASRIKLLPPRALLIRLSHRLQILTGGSQDMPERQRTLRNTLQWSYDLLTLDEQRLFRRLSIFVGGCQLSAIEAIYTALGERLEGLLDVITSLLDKSLLQNLDQEDADPRLYQFETIREFGWECLSSAGEMELLKRIHAQYYLHLSEEGAVKLTGPDQEHWYNLLEEELANLRAGLEWALSHDAVHALQMAGNLRRFWNIRGHLREGDRYITEALRLAQTQADVPLDTLAAAYHAAGELAYNLDEAERTEPLCQKSILLYQQVGNTTDVASPFYTLANLALDRGDYIEAKIRFEECLTLDPDGPYYATSHCELARLALRSGDYQQARTLLEKGLTIARTRGSLFDIEYALSLLVKVDLDQGNYDAAQIACEEALRLSRKLDNKSETSYLLSLLAQILVDKGDDVNQAHALLEESLLLARDINSPTYIFMSLLPLGELTLYEGKKQEALALFEECLIVSSQTGVERYRLLALLYASQAAVLSKKTEQAAHYLAECRERLKTFTNKSLEMTFLERLASLVSTQGEPERAIHLLAAAAVMRTALNMPVLGMARPFYDQTIADIRAQIGEQRWTSAWSEGQRIQPLTLEYVLAIWGESSLSSSPSSSSGGQKRLVGFPPEALALRLTSREMDVMRLLALGLSNKEIAERLVLSVVTVNSYLRSIYSKLGVTSRTAAMRYAIDHHLL